MTMKSKDVRLPDGAVAIVCWRERPKKRKPAPPLPLLDGAPRCAGNPAHCQEDCRAAGRCMGRG